ncbi:MAG: PilZ domain-containing protein [Desulfuromonadales bacterium]|jgi:uncharacterized protein (TIGR02266 family)
MTEVQGSAAGNKRARLRAPLLVLKVRVEDNGRVFFGYAKNIGRGGLFIATTNPREPGTRIKVEIPRPFAPKQTVQCTCEVVWKREFSRKSSYEPGMGLKFLDLPDADAEQLDTWIQGQLSAGENDTF